ncbi:MAG: DRTGG domain-containing protein [Proteiniphilum sp.]|jgi:predicted transcriptional regulator|nr:DRTGG domain-containing protein [Proteiniphilum sp.]MDD2726878.1 DRTGG domain-containing protein [Proteiniphilum sp.]MDD3332889.1 DRTGG domain-containing protein [Proteiniphilum sp.]MDD3556165.1 DRTGG domain-containing protein [Proteiniphilum sp.]MDD3979855.1 DRTGG domain-containing protein [Proteiniphilum sp.]
MKTNLRQLMQELGFTCLAGEAFLYRYTEGAYLSDLLSDAMGKAEAGMLWITSQVHRNIVAVASLKELSAIVVVNERQVEPEVLAHADEEEVVILSSGKPAFETAGMLYNYLREVER